MRVPLRLPAVRSRISHSSEPGWRRSRFAPLVLQVVQSLFQIRSALFQILQLGIPVVDVRDVVLHPGSNVKTATPELFDLFFLLRNRFVHSGDLAQYLLRAPAPVLFAVFSAVPTRIRCLRALSTFLRRVSHYR